MSSFAANFVSLARSKLHSSSGSGSRDNLSLHRWVLLKNSITHDDVYTGSNVSSATLVSDAPNVDEEDEEVDSDTDEGMFAFLFPDPGDAVTSADEGSVSEAQWLDSLLETLGDESEDSDADLSMKCIAAIDSDDEQQCSRADADSSCSSLTDDFISPSPIAVPYPVPYPPFHPPLVRPFDLGSSDDSFFASHSDSYSPYHHHDIEDPEGSVPDAIEDTSDDESDVLSTPFSRSRSSLNLVDPASIPLPHDRHGPRIYSASDDFFSYEVDPLPYSEYNSDSTAHVYSPYHQNC
ncbi:hypothetical protein DFH11DRAFT_1025608 [Phellopilus nigrolimitatus]|nr:hypothetical protein DFH11DRAFT_1025608 [Phellopilus nigrolimitatus]